MAKAKRKIQIEHEPIVGVFAARLREVRLSRGLTQADLANRAVVTPTYIAKLEGAKVAPGIDLVPVWQKPSGRRSPTYCPRPSRRTRCPC